MHKKTLILLTIAVSIFLSLSQVTADVGPNTPAPTPAPAPAVEPAAPAQAQVATYQSTVTTTYEEGEKSYNAGNKFVRGLANILASPLEVPRNIQNMTEEEGVFVGWTGGVCQGIGMTALRIITGAYDVITFPIPFPAGYAPVIEPEFVWDEPGPRITPQSSRE